MTRISDEDVEKILAEHSEQPRDVDEAMGIGKRAGDEIKVREANPNEKRGGSTGWKNRRKLDGKNFLIENVTYRWLTNPLTGRSNTGRSEESLRKV